MKKVLWVLLFTPLIAFAGHHENSCQTPPSQSVPQAPNVVVPVQPTPPTQQSSVPPPPVANQHPPNPSGGGQIYCSGPTAPGWNVSLPKGGCQTAPTPVKTIPLSAMPYTGGEGLNWPEAIVLGILIVCLAPVVFLLILKI